LRTGGGWDATAAADIMTSVAAGAYNYVCVLHPGMAGTVNVT
jgi:plastocyanin